MELSIKMDKVSSKRNINKIDLEDPQAKRVKLSATEIHEACLNNDTQKVITLYRNCKDIDVAEIDKIECLFIAVEKENLEIVKQLLFNCCNVDHFNRNGDSILHFISKIGITNLDIVKELVDYGRRQKVIK